MRLAQVITEASQQIISEWEQFAATCAPGMDLAQRRDHLVGMLQAIALDLATPQSKHEQTAKSKGLVDASVEEDTAANSHGTDRAATGYTPLQMVAEFRALRASILRLWSESKPALDPEALEEVTRFNEAIDQQLSESVAKYVKDLERSKDLFLGVLGHDLRTPLGAIMMSVSSMIAQEGADWTHLKRATRILNSSTRMEVMIGDLVDITRTRLGSGIPVHAVAMDLEEVCRRAIDELTALHPADQVTFAASGELHGQWDRGRISQMLSNLLGNAHQHGAANLPIEVTLRGEGEAVVLTVHNQGPMIAKDQLEEIFSPFRQLARDGSKAANPHSLGLGLYIARAIVTAHHGTIGVESSPHGTTFTVRLPRQ